jgi:hypothetical protein
MNCRLCDSFECKNLPVNDSRHFYLCENCGLIFVAVSGHLTFDEEKSRYDLHSNDSTNAGYVAFLNEVVSAIEKKCSAPARLLDYGCGKNKVLAGLLNQRGFVCDAYDPLYGIGSDVFSQKYDAIILCEVIEHVRNLSETTGRIRRSLGRGGIVVLSVLSGLR